MVAESNDDVFKFYSGYTLWILQGGRCEGDNAAQRKGARMYKYVGVSGNWWVPYVGVLIIRIPLVRVLYSGPLFS